MSGKVAEGPGMYRENFQGIVDRLSRKYGVEKDKIFLGNADTPPNAAECILYASAIGMGGEYTCVTVWIREGLRGWGDWINESMRDPDLDLRK